MKRKRGLALAMMALVLVCICTMPLVAQATDAPSVSKLVLTNCSITLGFDAHNNSRELSVKSAVYANKKTNKTYGFPDGVQFLSSNESIARVLTSYENGVPVARVTANAQGLTGTVKVYAAVNGRIRATCVVKVSSYIKATKITIPSKKTLYITDVLNDPDLQGKGALQLEPTITPAMATDQAVSYSTSKPSVATVDENGKITAVKPGSATITAKLSGNTKVRDTIKVTVKYLPPSSVSFVNRTSGRMEPGQQLSLTSDVGVSVLPQNVHTKTVSYSSSKSSVAKVDSKGNITAVAPGTATIKAKTKDGGKSASFTVTVDYKYRFYGIVNGDYYGREFDLTAYKNDISSMSKVYGAARFNGSKVKVSYKKNLTGSGIESYLSSIANASQNFPDDSVTIIYYTGHGLDSQIPSERGALCGVDINRDSAYVKVETVQSYLNQIKGEVFIVFDSCLSGQYIERKGLYAKAMNQAETALFNQSIINAFSGGASASSGKLRSSGGLTAKALRPANMHIVTGCASRELSWSGDFGYGYYSFMTFFFRAGTLGVNGQSSPFAADTSPKDGIVTLTELYNYMKPPVLQWSEEALRQNRMVGTVSNIMMWPANDDFPVYAVN